MRILKEPLFHFVLLGALLFVAYSVINWDRPADNEIVVSTQDIDNLVYTWLKKWNRPPRHDELNSLINDYIEEEVLSREAKAMGLDAGDNIVRRRLVQKMQFILDEDRPVVEPPTDVQIEKYLEDNKERYVSQPRYTFCQLLVSKKGDDTKKNMQLLKEKLEHKKDTSGVLKWGEPSMLPFYIQKYEPGEVDRLFGSGFADQLKSVRMDHWEGPLQSGFGIHFVFVYQTQEAKLPALADIRSMVEQDWADEQRAKINRNKMDGVIAKYKVRSELDKWLNQTASSN